MSVATEYLFSNLDKYQPGDEFPNVGYIRRFKAVADREALANPARSTAEDRPALVGIMGKKRHGKDSIARVLIEEKGFTRFAFADPMREALLAVNPVVPTPTRVGGMLDSGTRNRRLADVVADLGWEEAKTNREVRRLLQEFGVSIRALDEDFWVRTTLDKAEALGGPVVITDVRFPNEAEAIKARGGTLIRVVRPDVESNDQHISETALDDYVPDYTVRNEGTLEDLAIVVRALPL